MSHLSPLVPQKRPIRFPPPRIAESAAQARALFRYALRPFAYSPAPSVTYGSDRTRREIGMPVTARLSRKSSDKLGDEVANELVNWFNAVDASYRSELREMNELTSPGSTREWGNVSPNRRQSLNGAWRRSKRRLNGA